MAARAILGVFEGGAMPGMAFFLSTFYKREELLFRIGIYVSAASIAGAFGGLLATGLSKIPEWGVSGHTIHTWKNIFFFEGLITILIGLAAPIWMPTDPKTAWFLNEREKKVAFERLVREHRADPAEKVQWRHVKLAVMNVHNYTCALGFFLINITVQGLSVFMPTILKDLGWENTKAQLYSVPPYVCACVVAVAVAYGSDKTRKRGIWLAAFSVLALIGFAILRWVSQPNVRYMAVFFVTVGAFPGGPGFLSWAINSEFSPTRYVLGMGRKGRLTTSRFGGTSCESGNERLCRDAGYHWRYCCYVSFLLPLPHRSLVPKLTDISSTAGPTSRATPPSITPATPSTSAGRSPSFVCLSLASSSAHGRTAPGQRAREITGWRVCRRRNRNSWGIGIRGSICGLESRHR